MASHSRRKSNSKVSPKVAHESDKRANEESTLNLNESGQVHYSSAHSGRVFTPDHDLFWLDRRLDLLYRDYLDGAILHQSDIKTTEQLLGNLSIRSLFDYKMNLTPQERKMIEKLDLGSHRSLIGPFMWFSLITQSVSQALDSHFG